VARRRGDLRPARRALRGRTADGRRRGWVGHPARSRSLGCGGCRRVAARHTLGAPMAGGGTVSILIADPVALDGELEFPTVPEALSRAHQLQRANGGGARGYPNSAASNSERATPQATHARAHVLAPAIRATPPHAPPTPRAPTEPTCPAPRPPRTAGSVRARRRHHGPDQRPGRTRHRVLTAHPSPALHEPTRPQPERPQCPLQSRKQNPPHPLTSGVRPSRRPRRHRRLPPPPDAASRLGFTSPQRATRLVPRPERPRNGRPPSPERRPQYRTT
jgi:hypothetical protein